MIIHKPLLPIALLVLSILTLIALGCKDTSEPETIDVTFKGTLRNHCEDAPAPYTEFYIAVQEANQGIYIHSPRQEKYIKTDASGHFSVTFTMDRTELKRLPEQNVILNVSAFNWSIYEQPITVDVATGIWEQELVMRPSYKYQLQLRTNGNGNNYTNLDTLFFQGNSSDSTIYPKITYNEYKYFYIVGPFQDRLLSQDTIYINNNSNHFWFKYGLPSKGINYGLVQKDNIQRCNTTPDVYYIDLP